MGEFWGFQCGWWAWTCQFVDSAVYIALILGLRGQLVAAAHRLGAVAHRGGAHRSCSPWINIRGLDLVALSSIVFTVIIVAPFIVMTVLGFAHWHGTPLQPFLPSGESWWSSIGLGLAVGVWMYSGFDSMSTIAGEIERPRRVIPKALMISVPIIIASYLLPTIAGLAGVGHWAELDGRRERGGISFVQMARTLGGPILGYLMLGAAVISNMALYQEYLASGARPAYAMAEDRLLPQRAHEHPPQVRHAVGVDPAARGREPGAHHRHLRQPRRDRRVPQHVLLHPDLRGGRAAAAEGARPRDGRSASGRARWAWRSSAPRPW